MNYNQIASEVLEIEAAELKSAAKNISSFDLENIIDLILSYKGKLIVTGVGKSGLVGAKIAATLASTGTSSFFLHPTEAMHGDLGMIGKNDIVLAISYSGESEELIQLLPHLKRFDIPLIAMAKNKESTLAKYADQFIDISVSKEACPLDTAPTSSTTLTMAMGDAIAVCLLKKRDFKKIDDLQRRDNLPIVSRETKLKDAIVVMSEGRLGNVLITDSEGKLSSVLSDGDLRRALMNPEFTIDCFVEEISTKNPKVLDNKNLLASDALKIIEDYKIQLLVVTDNNRKIIGVIHIHDLIEAGIK